MPSKSTENEAANANGDQAVDPLALPKDHVDAPDHREVEALRHDEKHDHMAKREKKSGDRQEALLDEALEETFPGSDPISPKHIT